MKVAVIYETSNERVWDPGCTAGKGARQDGGQLWASMAPTRKQAADGLPI